MGKTAKPSSTSAIAVSRSPDGVGRAPMLSDVGAGAALGSDRTSASADVCSPSVRGGAASVSPGSAWSRSSSLLSSEAVAMGDALSEQVLVSAGRMVVVMVNLGHRAVALLSLRLVSFYSSVVRACVTGDRRRSHVLQGGPVEPLRFHERSGRPRTATPRRRKIRRLRLVAFVDRRCSLQRCTVTGAPSNCVENQDCPATTSHRRRTCRSRRVRRNRGRLHAARGRTPRGDEPSAPSR